MQVDYLYVMISFEIFPKARNENIETAAQKIIVGTPNFFKYFVAAQNFVRVFSKKPDEFHFFKC